MSERVADLVVFWRQFIQALLDDVIAVQVLNEYDNVETKRDDDRMNLAMVSMISLLRPPPPFQWTGENSIMNYTCLSPCGQKVDHFLNSPCSVHIERDIDKVLGDGLANNVSLLVGGILQ
jgi:hypothetical protein